MTGYINPGFMDEEDAADEVPQELTTEDLDGSRPLRPGTYLGKV